MPICLPHTFAVIGAGNGGQALCAWLKHLGHRVSLWDRNPEKLEQLQNVSAFRTQGALNCAGRPDMITTKLGDALADATFIMVVTSADAHYEIAEKLAPFLRPDQIVVLNPGRTAGALAFQRVLSGDPDTARCQILEAQSLLFTCRIRSPGLIDVFARKKHIQIAGIPQVDGTEEYWSVLKTIYDEPLVESTTLVTSLNNFGAILHPTLMALNAGWIEARPASVSFRFYHQGVGTHVAKFIERMDQERMELANSLKIRAWNLETWMGCAYQTGDHGIDAVLRSNPAYADIEAPRTIRHRYFFEDVPTGLIPMAELGRRLGCPCHAMEAIISMAEQLLEEDLHAGARTLERLGLANRSIEEIGAFFRGTSLHSMPGLSS